MKRAVFLDRDGTIIEEREYLRDPAQVSVFPGVPTALKRLQDFGYLLFIVSNQSGVGRGYFSMADVEQVNAELLKILARHSVSIRKIYIAPEAPDQPSRGRKPSPQFLWDARDEFDLNLAESYVIGDKWIDLECGWNAGVKKSILVRTGYGTQTERSQLISPPPSNVMVADDLKAAVKSILNS